MATTAQEVIDRVRDLVNDVASQFVSGQRWSDVELLEWLSDGQFEIVKLLPEANVLTESFACSPTFPRQRLNPITAYRLIRVEANTSGANFRLLESGEFRISESGDFRVLES